jgi:hypothetical protein
VKEDKSISLFTLSKSALSPGALEFLKEIWVVFKKRKNK